MNKKIPDKYTTVLVCVFLIVVIFAVFGRVWQHEFISLDDPDYVTNNKYVQKGLTGESFAWAFTTFHASNWHPLTWLSLMLDYQLFGLEAGVFHLTNVFFHIVNTLLLFLVLKKMTGGFWQSSFVAAAFGLHPLHVESVAWVAERKDILSTLFWFLTMWAYLHYTERVCVGRYLLVFLSFVLGLMAKPMLVTLPFVLLLLDFWPLNRFQNKGRLFYKLILEKIPLLGLSAVSAVITVIAQRKGGAVISIKVLDFGWRISNAFVSYVVYIVKLIVPAKLAIFYPNMSAPGMAKTIGAVMILVCITVGVMIESKRRKYLAVGWLWYLGTLVPVIGIVQVGAQAYADRYTYVPLIGLFIIIAWLIPDMLGSWRYKKEAIIICTIAVMVPMAAATTLQVHRWRDLISLFEHAIAVTEENCVAHNALANKYGQLGQIDKCIAHSKEAIRIFPRYYSAHYNLAMGYYRKGEFRKAIEHWEKALKFKRDYGEVNYNIGISYQALGKFKEAVDYFSRELAINPEHKMAQQKRDNLLAQYPDLKSE